MADPDWGRVLDKLYTEQITVETRTELVETVAKNSELSEKQVDNAVSDLQSLGLIDMEYWDLSEDEEEPEYIPLGGLTKDGFDVAHDRRQTAREHEVNLALVYLTMVLGLGAVIQGAGALAGASGLSAVFLGGAVLATATVLVYIVYSFDLHRL